MTKFYSKSNNFRSVALTASILFAIIATLAFLVTINHGKAQGQEAAPGSVIKLASANIAIDIPLAKGYQNGNEIFFIATDASDEKIAQEATKLLGFKVNFAPSVKLMHSQMEFLEKDHLDFKFLY